MAVRDGRINVTPRAVLNPNPVNGEFAVQPDTSGQQKLQVRLNGAWQEVTVQGAVSGGVAVKDEGSVVVASATGINFTGAGVTASDGGSGVATVNIPGGGGGAIPTMPDIVRAWGDWSHVGTNNGANITAYPEKILLPGNFGAPYVRPLVKVTSVTNSYSNGGMTFIYLMFPKEFVPFSHATLRLLLLSEVDISVLNVEVTGQKVKKEGVFFDTIPDWNSGTITSLGVVAGALHRFEYDMGNETAWRPGARAFTVMPHWPTSWARARVRAIPAPLDAT